MNIQSISTPGRARQHAFSPVKGQPLAYRYYNEKTFESLPQMQALSEEQRFEIKVVSSVLPFKVNTYVINELIDWSCVPDDPIFQLTFPQRGMLHGDDFEAMAALLKSGARFETIKEEANRIRMGLNPHPAAQMTLNVPSLDGQMLPGIQHKYKETALFFPAAGQTCHAYCTFCFRWPQFTGMEGMRFAAKETDTLKEYLIGHPEITNVLFTGGDPLVMKTDKLMQYVEPLLDPSLDSIQTIRFGTKSLAYWPQRFVTDPDADDLLRLFERIVASGRSVAVMAHYSHYVELEPAIAKEAVRRIRETGAVIRSQSPVLAHINDTAGIWELMWREQVRLGIVPYYMFIERDTGAKDYFKIPLYLASRIFREAFRHVNGLARTVRGPSMSATPGKVEITGVSEIAGEKIFALRFLQSRIPDWVGKPFFATFDKAATWLDDLKPAFGEKEFFFEEQMRQLYEQKLRTAARAGNNVSDAG